MAAGETLARAGEIPVQVDVRGEPRTWDARNLILDVPGNTNEWVVVCAHYDGHQLAESALDNATGVAAVLEIGRRLAPLVRHLRRGIRLALFTCEEWGLVGSRHYVEQLSQAERDAIAAVIALDSITGHPRMSALISESERLEQTRARGQRGHRDPIRHRASHLDEL